MRFFCVCCVVRYSFFVLFLFGLDWQIFMRCVDLIRFVFSFFYCYIFSLSAACFPWAFSVFVLLFIGSIFFSVFSSLFLVVFFSCMGFFDFVWFRLCYCLIWLRRFVFSYFLYIEFVRVCLFLCMLLVGVDFFCCFVLISFSCDFCEFSCVGDFLILCLFFCVFCEFVPGCICLWVLVAPFPLYEFFCFIMVIWVISFDFFLMVLFLRLGVFFGIICFCFVVMWGVACFSMK